MGYRNGENKASPERQRMTEKELKPKIVKWLNDNGYEAAHECYNFNNCDVIGFEFYKQQKREIPDIKRIVAIELKVRDILGVLLQCRTHRHNATTVYAAMPESFCKTMTLKSKLKFFEQGIGLLSVGENVKIEVISLNYLVDLNKYKKSLWQWHKKNMKALKEE